MGRVVDVGDKEVQRLDLGRDVRSITQMREQITEGMMPACAGSSTVA